jgi:hypothetical protein
MAIISCVGIDPGYTVGICRLLWSDAFDPPLLARRVLLAADADSAEYILHRLLDEEHDSQITQRFCGVEKWAPGAGGGAEAKVTRQLVMELTEVMQEMGYKVHLRTASEVKPWASDKRIKAAGVKGLSSVNGKSRDAYDGARQALYVSHWDAKLPDPLLGKQDA